jgi:hypothetical protein
MIELLLSVFVVCLVVRIIFALVRGGVEALLQLIFHPLHSLAVICGFVFVIGLIGAIFGV